MSDLTLSGLNPDMLKHAKLTGANPILAVELNRGKREPLDCCIAFPGCDFEVLILQEIPYAFRRKDIYTVRDNPNSAFARSMLDLDVQMNGENTVEFNRSLLNNMLIALKRVTTNEDIVAESRYFVKIITDAIDTLEYIAAKRNPARMREAIAKLKVQLFSRMMSRDLRR